MFLIRMRHAGASRRALGRRSRRMLAGGAGLAAAMPSLASLGAASSAPAQGRSSSSTPPIKHVWLIILENKSYDATFTGLNDNTCLWKTLPGRGVRLKTYLEPA